MDNKLRLALAASTLQSWLASALEHPASICSTGLAYVQLQPVHVLVEKPVQLSAYITSNTTIAVDETLTITVTDAPLVLVTELTQYETITSFAKSLCDERGECLSDPGSTELGLAHSTSNPLVPHYGADSSASALASPTKSSVKDSSVSNSSLERVNTIASSNPTQDTTATASALQPNTETEQQQHQQTSQGHLSGQSSTETSDNLATAGSIAGLSKAKTSLATVPFSEDSTSTSYPQRQPSSPPLSSTEDFRSQKNTNAAFEGSSTYSGRRSSSGLSPSSAAQSEQPGLSSLLSTLSKSTSLPSTIPENGAQTSASLSPTAHPSFSTNASLDTRRSKTETTTGYVSEPPSSLTPTQYTTFSHKYVGPEPSESVPQQTLRTSFEHAQSETVSLSTLLASTLTSTAAPEVSSASESGSTSDFVHPRTSSEEPELPITSGQSNLYSSSTQNNMGPTTPSTAEPLTSSAVSSTDAQLTSISSTTQSALSSFRQPEQSSPTAKDKVKSSTLEASESLSMQRLKGSSTTSASPLAPTSSEISKVSTTRNAPESTTALTDLESLTSPEPAKTSTGVRWPTMQPLEASNTTSLGTSTSTLIFSVTTQPLESTTEETSKTESEFESSATSESVHEELSTAGPSVPTSSTSESGNTKTSASESTISGPESSESSTAESSTIELSTAEWSTAGPLATSSSTSESATVESLAFESTTSGPTISGPETSESSSAESSTLSETAAPTPAKLPTAYSLTPESSTIEPSTSTSTTLESSVLWPTTAESSTSALTNLDSTTLESATTESSALDSATTQSSIPEPPATSLSTDESLPTESSTSIPMTSESKISSTSTASMDETTPAARVPETFMSSDISKTLSTSEKIESSVTSEPLWYSTSQVTTILSSSEPSETTSTTEIPISESTTADLGPDSQTDTQTTALTTTSLESSSIADLQTTTNSEVSTTTSSAASISTSEVGCISDADCNQDEICDTDSRQCIVSKPDQSCSNAGLEYAVYDNPYYNSDILDYADFDVTHFHGATPLFEGITDRVGIAQGQNPYYPPIKVYDDSEAIFLQYKAISHVALLYAPYSGDYEISVPVSDEITLVWVGDKAISGWTRENADVEQRYHYETREPQVVRIHLEAGSYNNLRILWANGQGEFSFILSIKAPNGDVIVDGTESNTDYLVRFPCGDEAVF